MLAGQENKIIEPVIQSLVTDLIRIILIKGLLIYT